MQKQFTIDKISWHTQAKRNYQFDKELLYSAFKSIIVFLQNNNLTTRTILSEDQNVTEDTCLLSTDLTDVGFQLVKKKYGSWLEGVMDKGKPPTDLSIFQKELTKIKTQ